MSFFCPETATVSCFIQSKGQNPSDGLQDLHDLVCLYLPDLDSTVLPLGSLSSATPTLLFLKYAERVYTTWLLHWFPLLRKLFP